MTIFWNLGFCLKNINCNGTVFLNRKRGLGLKTYFSQYIQISYFMGKIRKKNQSLHKICQENCSNFGLFFSLFWFKKCWFLKNSQNFQIFGSILVYILEIYSKKIKIYFESQSSKIKNFLIKKLKIFIFSKKCGTN